MTMAEQYQIKQQERKRAMPGPGRDAKNSAIFQQHNNFMTPQ